MAERKIKVGVDIGGTNTIYGFVDEEGKIISSGSFPTFSDEPPERLVEKLATSIKNDFLSLCDDGARLYGIGIGAPNANYYTGKIENPPNFKWGIVPFVDMIKKHFDLKVVITNDANAAALGELFFGAAKKKTDFVVITLGTGLGSGIVSGGKLLLGHDGFAGEMGHMLAVSDSDRKCGCGKKGCLETYASATGLVKTAKELLIKENMQSSLRLIDKNELSSEDIGIAAAKGDILALKVFDLTARVLGVQLANATAILSWDSIFLFGGVANSGDLLLIPLRKYFEESLFHPFKGKVKIELSALQTENAAILGAAALVESHLD